MGPILNSVLSLWEIVIYMNISHHIYKMDKAIMPNIPEQSYKRRTRKNAIDLLGHMIQFFIETATLIIGMIFFGTKNPNFLAATMFLASFMHGFTSIVLMSTNPILQSEFKSIFV